jgi:hypothetical protein
VQFDAAHRVGQGPFQAGHGQLTGRGGLRQVFQGLDTGQQTGEELLGAQPPDHHRAVPGDEFGGPALRAEGRAPEHGITTRGAAFETGDQRVVPLGGPAADDQPVLVQHLIHQPGPGGRVLLQLALGVAGLQVGQVAVQFDDRGAGVRQRRHPEETGGTVDDLRLHPRRLQRLLEETVEVGGQHHAYPPARHQPGHRPVRRPRPLEPLPPVRLAGPVGLEVAPQQLVPGGGGVTQRLQQGGVAERSAVPVAGPPGLRIGGGEFLVRAARDGGPAHQVRDDLPPRGHPGVP